MPSLWVSGRPLPLPLGEVMMQSEDGEGNTMSIVPGVGATIGRPRGASRETDCHCEETAESGRRGNLSGGHST